MADKKISELTELTTPASDDVLAIVDTGATVTKKISLAILFGSVVASIVATADSTYSLGSTSVRWLKGWFDNITVANIDGDVNVENVYPKTADTYSFGATATRWLKGWFKDLDVSGDVLPTVDNTSSLGATAKKWLKGWFYALKTNTMEVSTIVGQVETESIVPKTTLTYSLGSAILNWLDGHFNQITLGGVARTTWPTAGSGSQSMDDVYNNGSEVAVDNTDAVYKLTATKHFKITNADESETYLDITGGGECMATSSRVCENGCEQVQYPLPTSAYMLKAAADGSPATATNTDAEVAAAVTAVNANTGTTATSFKINSGGNEADLQTTGLTSDRDFTFPDIDTMIAGAAATCQNGFEIIAYA